LLASFNATHLTRFIDDSAVHYFWGHRVTTGADWLFKPALAN